MMGYLEGAFDALNDVLKKSVPPNVYKSWTAGARALGELSPGAAIRDVKEESAAMVDAAREGRWLDAGAGPAKMAVAMAGIVPPIRAARVASKTVAAPIRGYHGSPHDFAAERLVKLPDGRTEYIVGAPDKLPIVPPRATVIQDFPLGRFRADKIGTGEGAQAYGHGAAYIAENEGVARGYRDRLVGSPTWANLLPKDVQSAIPKGHMYEVGIHADPAKFLDWDKPLSQQGDALKAVKAAYGTADPHHGLIPTPVRLERMVNAGATGEDAYRFLGTLKTLPLPPDPPGTPRGWGFVQRGDEGQRGASVALRDAGIPGIRYLDAGSRSSGAGSSNLIPFDESIIEILRKYGLIPAAAAGAGAAAVPGLLSPTQEY